MYKVIWTEKALLMFRETLEFWKYHNQSNQYSLKISRATKDIEIRIQKNPKEGKFRQVREVFQMVFLNGRFSLFYKIENTTIYIVHFQSNSQRPYCNE